MPKLDMNELASGLDLILNGPAIGKERTVGFALLVYPFGDKPDKGNINYVGNGAREDVLIALKELVARWEGRYTETSTKQ